MRPREQMRRSFCVWLSPPAPPAASLWGWSRSGETTRTQNTLIIITITIDIWSELTRQFWVSSQSRAERQVSQELGLNVNNRDIVSNSSLRTFYCGVTINISILSLSPTCSRQAALHTMGHKCTTKYNNTQYHNAAMWLLLSSDSGDTLGSLYRMVNRNDITRLLPV